MTMLCVSKHYVLNQFFQPSVSSCVPETCCYKNAQEADMLKQLKTSSDSQDNPEPQQRCWKDKHLLNWLRYLFGFIVLLLLMDLLLNKISNVLAEDDILKGFLVTKGWNRCYGVFFSLAFRSACSKKALEKAPPWQKLTNYLRLTSLWYYIMWWQQLVDIDSRSNKRCHSVSQKYPIWAIMLTVSTDHSKMKGKEMKMWLLFKNCGNFI